MKNSRILIFAAALLTLGAGASLAADDTASHDITINVSEVALLSLDDTSTTTFDIGPPASGTGGDAFGITGSSNTIKYLRYTSIVAPNQERTITAEISTGSLPPGIGLTLEAESALGGCGTLGSAEASTPLTEDATEIVIGIGSGYTKTEGDHGVRVKYTLDEIDCSGDACNVVVDPTTLTVTYTLTAGA